MDRYVYGRHLKLGWGAVELNDQFQYIDFDPEFECNSDVTNYWKNRKHILKLPKVTYVKYIKTLIWGLRLKHTNKLLKY